MKTHNQDTNPNGEKVLRYGIRKFKFGAASVAVAATLFMGSGPVAQAQEQEAPALEVENQTLEALPEVEEPLTSAAVETLPQVTESVATPVEEAQKPQAEPVSTSVEAPLEPVVSPQEAPTEESAAVSASPQAVSDAVEVSPAAPAEEAPKAEPAVKQEVPTAPAVTTVNKDVYVFKNTPFEAKVAEVEAPGQVSVSLHQAAGAQAGSELELPGVLADAQGNLSGQVAEEGLHRRQVVYTNEQGSASTETISVHAVDVSLRELRVALNQTPTVEEILGALVIKRGNDTTLSDDQIGRRVVTKIEDYPAKVSAFEVEVSLPDGTSKIVEVRPQVTGTTGFRSVGRTAFRAAGSSGVNAPVVTGVPSNIYSFFGQNINVPLNVSTETPIERVTMHFLNAPESQVSSIPGITVTPEGLITGVAPEVAGIYTREILFRNATGTTRTDQVRFHVINVTTNEVPVEYGVPVSEEVIRNAVEIEKGNNPFINDNDIIRSVIIPDGGLPTYGTSNISVVVELPDGSTKVVSVPINFSPMTDAYQPSVTSATYPDTSSTEAAAEAIRNAVTVDPGAGNLTKVVEGHVPTLPGDYVVPVKVIYPDLSEKLVEVPVKVTPDSAQAAAKQAVERVTAEKLAAIDNYDNLTTEEKNAAKAQVEAEKAKAVSAIEAAATAQAIDNAKTAGTSAVTAVPLTPVVKPEAVAAITQAADDKKAAIDAQEGLTPAEKDAAKAQVDAEKDKAIAAVNTNTTNAAVTSAKDSGVSAIEAITATSAKPAAIDAINDAARQKRLALNSNRNLTREERAEARAAIERERQAALAAVEAANTPAEITAAQTKGVETVSALSLESAVKTAARQNIDQLSAAKKAEIENRTDLTPEEKASAQALVDKEADKLRDAVNKSTTNAEVAVTTRKADQVIPAINPQANANPAIAELDQAAETKKAEIDRNPELTTEEKAAAKAQVDAEKDKAIAAVRAAGDQSGAALEAGRQAIDSFVATPVAKPAAIDAINEAARQKRLALNSNRDLTREEKAEARAAIEAERQAALAAVENATTTAAVTAAQDKGVADVTAVSLESAVKTAARQTVAALSEAKKAEIDNNPNLTTEEKAAAKDAVDKEAAKLLDAISKSGSNAEVAITKKKATDVLPAINPQASVKPTALAELTQAIADKKAAIEADSSLTDGEKARALADLDAEAARLTQAINDATGTAETDQVKASGLATIAAINPTSQVKPAAIAAVNQAADERLRAIEATPEATPAEKQIAREQVERERATAIANINSATTDEVVDKAKDTGLTALAAVKPEAQTRPAALADLERVTAAKLAEIDSNRDLTDEEKAAARQAVTAERAKAEAAINQATTVAELTAATNLGTSTITALTPAPVAKPAAIDALNQAAAAKVASIEDNGDLTNQEKQTAIDQVEAERRQAQAAVEAATTNAAVQSAEQAGQTAIAAINPVSQVKPAALAALNQAAADKVAAIDAMTTLTDEEKAAAKASVEAERRQAVASLDTAVTDEAIRSIVANSQAAQASLSPVPATKTKALADLDQAILNKQAAINGNDELTLEEKAAALANLAEERRAGEAAIAAATTNAAVAEVAAASEAAVAAVNPQPVAKPAAREAINRVAEDRLADIDANYPNATLNEKQIAKDQVNREREIALGIIDSLLTTKAIEAENDALKTAIAVVQPEAQAKAEAIADVNEVTDAKLAFIDANDVLTLEEKAAAREQAEASRLATIAKIEAADTDEAITALKNEGVSGISEINPEPVVKQTAIDALNALVSERLAAIAADADLTAEERVEAERQLKEQLATAVSAILAATDQGAVTAAQGTGQVAVEAVDVIAEIKPKAIAEINDIANAKLATIDGNNNLTVEEREVYRQQIEAERQDALAKIEQAASNKDVEVQKATETEAIRQVTPESTVKSLALTAIEEAVAQKLAAIQADSTLTEEEKASLVSELTAKRAVAVREITRATTLDGIANLRQQGVTSIGSLAVVGQIKPVALEAIDQQAAARAAAIEARQDLTAEEKAGAKAEIERQRLQARDAILAATGNDGVNNARANGAAQIASVNPSPEAKPIPTEQPTPDPQPEPQPEPTPVPQPEPQPEPTPVPQPEPQPEPTPVPQPEPTTIFLDEDGQPLAVAEGHQSGDKLDGYYIVSSTTDSQGNVVATYRQVRTAFVDENGIELSPELRGAAASGRIPGYYVKETIVDEHGNTTYIYAKLTTSFVDDQGRQVAPAEEGTRPDALLAGYELVSTRTDANGNVVNTYARKEQVGLTTTGLKPQSQAPVAATPLVLTASAGVSPSPVSSKPVPVAAAATTATGVASSSEQTLPATGEKESLVGLQFMVWTAALAMLAGRVSKKQD